MTHLRKDFFVDLLMGDTFEKPVLAVETAGILNNLGFETAGVLNNLGFVPNFSSACWFLILIKVLIVPPVALANSFC